MLSAEQASNKTQRQELASELDSLKAQLSETLGALESERSVSTELRQQLDSIKSEYIISGDLLEAEQSATMALRKSVGELEKKVDQLSSSNRSLKQQVGWGKKGLEVGCPRRLDGKGTQGLIQGGGESQVQGIFWG
jgi:chromosome segregation ATPase